MKTYINPQTEILNVTSDVMQAGMNITHHSGGGSFGEGEIL